MANIPGTIPLGGPIAPTSIIDVYATHFAQFQFGGWRAVNDTIERDAIPIERREEGMVVYIKQPIGIEYELVGGVTNSHWQVKSGSGGVSYIPYTDKFIIDATIINNGYITLTNTPNIIHEHTLVILNGIILDDGITNDFTMSGNTITITFPIEIGDKLIVKYKY